MILTAHQPVYLPWLGLFHKIALSDTFCYFDDVQYLKKDWNNRNKIKFSNGKAGWLSVPVLNACYRDKSIIEIEINNIIPWQRKHLKTIEHNYRKAKYFNDYYPLLRERIYVRSWKYLSDLNYEMLLLFLKILGIEVKVVKMSNYNFKGQKSELVLDMCSQLEADYYIFGKLGKNYADVEKFNETGVIPYFQEYNHPVYPQLYGDFISHLSIIDLIFNCGHNSLDVLMSGNISFSELERWYMLGRNM